MEKRQKSLAVSLLKILLNIIKIGENLIPIEVKYTNFTSPKLGRSFINFAKKYKPPRGLILTKGFWEEAKINKTDVLFAPVWFI